MRKAFVEMLITEKDQDFVCVHTDGILITSLFFLILLFLFMYSLRNPDLSFRPSWVVFVVIRLIFDF